MGRGRVDTERQFRAMRPRMPKSTGGTVTTVVVPTPPHTHAAHDITSIPETYIASENVQDALDEIDVEKLARSGAQTMLGDLDHDHHSIVNVDDADIEGTATVGEDVVLTEGVGGAKITNPRVISLAGDDDDGEARLENAERIVFNNEPTKSVIELPSRVEYNTGVTAADDYTAAEGKSSWDDLEGTLVVWVASGAALVLVAVGWAVKLASNGLYVE